MKYKHGIYVDEVPTTVPTPKTATSGIQVVFGIAPINLADDPAPANTPILCKSFEEARSKLGYSTDFTTYPLCAAMYASFVVAKVSPVVFVNVLDITNDTKKNNAKTVQVVSRKAKYDVTGVILSSISVKNGDTALTEGTDYEAKFTDDETVLITLKSAEIAEISVSSTSINPSLMSAEDIIGTDIGGVRTGIECVKDVYPICQVVPATLLAPGFGKNPEVGRALCDKTKYINGVWRSFAVLDLDPSATYDNVIANKENAGFTSEDSVSLWPEVIVGGKVVPYSAAFAAGMQRIDDKNGGCPTRTPSNVDMGIEGCVMEDGTEINLDFEDANALNAAGIVTAIRAEGWKTWGVETSAYPTNTDPKDHFTGPRRMFSWQANSLIRNYIARLDDNISKRTIESIVNDENVRCNSLAAQGKWAGGYIEFRSEDNDISDIMAGKVTFKQHIAPFTPLKEMVNTLEYDADILAANFTGGEA